MRTDKCIWILEDDLGAQFVYEEILGIRYTLRFFIDLQSFSGAFNKSSQSELPDMVIADLRLPDDSFLGFMQTQYSNFLHASIPIFVVSSLDDIDVLRLCFQQGAVDYITKPFKKSELIVKIERIFSKEKYDSNQNCKDLKLDPTSLSVSKGQFTPVPLTAKEFQIIALLKGSKDRMMSRSELSSKIWGNLKVDPKSLDVHLVNLRKKLDLVNLEIRFQPPNLFCLMDRKNSELAAK